MKIFKEHETVRTTRPLAGDPLEDELRYLPVPAGSIGTIVAVLGEPDRPSRYEIEFYLEESKEYVVAMATPDILESA